MTIFNKLPLLILAALFVACTSDLVEGDIDSNDDDTRPTLTTPEGFDFKTHNDVQITINDENSEDNPIYKVYTEFRTPQDGDGIQLSYDEILSDGIVYKQKFSGAVTNGLLNKTLQVPTYSDKVFIRRKGPDGFTDYTEDILGNSVSISHNNASRPFSNYKSSNTFPNNGTMTEDVFINGNLLHSGNVNTNGHDLEVTGSLSITGGQINLSGQTTIKANIVSISVANLNLNGGSIYGDIVQISANTINGPGYIYYCTSEALSVGNINQNQQDSTVQQQCSDDSDGDGVNDVDDAYPDDADKAFEIFGPSPTGYGMLAFEDLWPSFGDYDFNDVDVRYRVTVILNANNEAVQVDFLLSTEANGAGFINGFGIELEGVASSLVQSVSGTVYTESYINLNSNGTEAGQQDAVIIATDNQNNLTDERTISVVFNQPVNTSQLGAIPFNPFIIKNSVRVNEIHLPFYNPTDLGSNTSPQFTGASRDLDGDYISEDGYPWALNIMEDFYLPNEKVRVEDAYNFFTAWAISGGSNNPDWYKDLPGNINLNLVQD